MDLLIRQYLAEQLRLQLLHIPRVFEIKTVNIVAVVESLVNPRQKTTPITPVLPCGKQHCLEIAARSFRAGIDSQVPMHVTSLL
jgi:hypothetical protein